MTRKERFFEEKNVFIFLKNLHKNGKAQNMPVVAGRLVILWTEQIYLSKTESQNFCKSNLADCQSLSMALGPTQKSALQIAQKLFDENNSSPWKSVKGGILLRKTAIMS